MTHGKRRGTAIGTLRVRGSCSAEGFTQQTARQSPQSEHDWKKETKRGGAERATTSVKREGGGGEEIVRGEGVSAIHTTYRGKQNACRAEETVSATFSAEQ